MVLNYSLAIRFLILLKIFFQNIKNLFVILSFTPRRMLIVKLITVFLFTFQVGDVQGGCYGYPSQLLGNIVVRFVSRLTRGHPCTICDPQFYFYGHNRWWWKEERKSVWGRKPSWGGVRTKCPGTFPIVWCMNNERSAEKWVGLKQNISSNRNLPQ